MKFSAFFWLAMSIAPRAKPEGSSEYPELYPSPPERSISSSFIFLIISFFVGYLTPKFDAALVQRTQVEHIVITKMIIKVADNSFFILHPPILYNVDIGII